MPTSKSLTVLITYYNEKAMLRECLQSLAHQTVAPDEVLIYDDCSQFPASDYLIPDLPVKVIRGTVNAGPSAGRNRLLDECSADYIHFHDADDLFCANWCETVRSQIAAAGSDLILSEITLFREEKIIRERFYGFGSETDVSDLLRLAIRVALVPSTGTYRTERVRRIGGYNSEIGYGEDYDFHLRLLLSGVDYTVISEPLIRQRAHSANRVLNKAACLISAVQTLNRLLPQIPVNYHAEVAEASANLGSDLYRCGLRKDAREAFALSRRSGAAAFNRYRAFYRRIAYWCGQETAEQVSAFWRVLHGR